MIKKTLSASAGQTAVGPRSIPLEQDGAPNDWKALVDHYSEAELRNQALEQSYKATKMGLLKNTLVDQQIREEDTRRRLRAQELVEEQNLVAHDNWIKEQERQRQELQKRKQQETFAHSNAVLIENRRKLKEDERDQRMMSEMELLEQERASPDLNLVRAQQRQALTKKVFEDNLRLQNQPNLDQLRGQELRYSQSIDHMGGPIGDIFDPLFERPKHWRNFYGNIVQGHQMAKISKHEEKFLQSQMMRDKQRQQDIDGGVVRQRLAESLNDMKSNQEKNEKKNNFQREITELYNQIQAKKEYDKEDRKAFFIERGMERRDRIEDDKRQQVEKLRARRFEQNQYKDILDIQRNEMDEKRYNRHRMTDMENKSNLDDLQEYKNLGLYVHTRSVPGLAPSIDPNMAKRVLGLFNK